MSTPPQGGWPPQQPPPYGQPFDPSAFNPQQQPPPPGWQQGSWPQPSPPPQKGSSVKWLLIAVAVLLVIAISVGVTLIFTRGSGGGQAAPATSGAPSDVASAGDTGPVAIITDEPTCQTLYSINSIIANIETNGWGDQRHTLGPAAEWTPDQRAQVQAVATAMRNAADQMVALARQTPHRVIRELYEQFIAYGRAYADSVPSYTPASNFLADTNVAISNALLGICNAITYRSTSRALGVAPSSPPARATAPSNPADPQEFVKSSDSACTSWIANEDRFLASTDAWQKLDSKIPSAEWTPEQRATQLAVLPILTTLANDMESVGRNSGNPVFEDFAVLGALYFRAYVSAGDSYAAADSWLSYTGLRINNAISAACHEAAGS
jgi:hypothetical protein